MTWFARLRERVFAPYSLHKWPLYLQEPPPELGTPSRFRGITGWRIEDVPPQPRALHWSDGSAPVTEISRADHDTWRTLDTGIVGRPVYCDWHMLRHALWPRPDPSKRWRLFIQEDTRP